MNADLWNRYGAHRCTGAMKDCPICVEYSKAIFDDERKQAELRRKAEAYVKARGRIVNLLRNVAETSSIKIPRAELKRAAGEILKELGEV